MRVIKYLFVSFFCFFTLNVLSDNIQDSLYKLLSQKISDTTRINVYNELCWPVYSFINTDSAIKYGEMAIKLSKSINDPKRLVKAYRRIGVAYINNGNTQMAIKYAQLSYDLAKTIGDKKSMASALNNIGVAYLNMSDYRAAIDYSLKKQKLQEELKDSSDLFNTYYNLGLLFKNIDELKTSKQYYLKAKQIVLKKGISNELAFTYEGLSLLLMRENKPDSALPLLKKAEEIFIELNDKKGLVELYSTFAILHEKKKDYASSIKYYKKALNLNEEYNNPITKSNLLGNLGQAYTSVRKYDSAIYFAKQAIELAGQNKDYAEIAFSSNVLSFAYEKTGNTKEALKFFHVYATAQDSVNNIERNQGIVKKQLGFEYQRKAIADSLKSQEEKRFVSSKLEHEKTLKYFFILIALLILGFAVYVFNRLKFSKQQNLIIEEQKNKVDEKQKEILDSIRYAKLIQDAILENQIIMKSLISDYGVFFKPKDIVSGDFYWAHKKSDYFYLAVCDCTGHGVPGAFMSLLSIGFLNEAINDNDIVQPNEIFNYVRQRLIQSVNKESQKDGFDGILISINFKTKKITYAAANNKPVLISSGQIIEQAVDKMPVGQGVRMESFNLYELNAKPGDTVYLYTDGYADQFGGPKGKKFKYKPLNDLLLAISSKTFEVQKEELRQNFKDWKGNLEQIDDVCVLGIKL